MGCLGQAAGEWGLVEVFFGPRINTDLGSLCLKYIGSGAIESVSIGVHPWLQSLL